MASLTAVRPTNPPKVLARSSRRPSSRRPSIRVTAAATGVMTNPPQQREQQPSPKQQNLLPLPPLPVPGWLWPAAEEQAPGVPSQVQPTTATKQQPILSFAGGGIFFWWELGCLRYLHRNFDLSQVQLVGASAGGLIATLAACGVDEDKAVRVANRLAQEYGVFERPGGLAGIWGSIIRRWLDELLPENAAQLCAGRVRLVVTEAPSLRLRYLQDFESKQDLIDANMASVHIPFFLDGNATCTYRGRSYIDGSLWDFLLSDNSDLIKCDGEACIIDYFNDDQLTWSRLDFIKLADLAQVQAFVQTGYAYAQRTDASSDLFERTLGGMRKGPVRRALEVPVWSLRRALASIDG